MTVPASAHRSAQGERTVVRVSHHTPPSKRVAAKCSTLGASSNCGRCHQHAQRGVQQVEAARQDEQPHTQRAPNASERSRGPPRSQSWPIQERRAWTRQERWP